MHAFPMFIEALVIVANTWKEHKCPPTDEWIKKMWFMYSVEYYSAIKRQNNAIHSSMDETKDFHTK